LKVGRQGNFEGNYQISKFTKLLNFLRGKAGMQGEWNFDGITELTELTEFF
jgi:hypothetical protein